MSLRVESNYAIYLDKYKDEAERYHKGEVALMVNCEIIEYFPTANDAYDAGYERYGLGNFSIQEIGAAPKPCLLTQPSVPEQPDSSCLYTSSAILWF